MTTMRSLTICGCLALASSGCARDPRAAEAAARQEAAFEAARNQCGVTVADTAEVQRCMRAKGWAYRLPWQ